MPKTAEPWSLTSLREKLIKIGAKVVSHGRYVTFQMAEVAVPRQMFAEFLSLIARPQAPPAPACQRRCQMRQTCSGRRTTQMGGILSHFRLETRRLISAPKAAFPMIVIDAYPQPVGAIIAT